jgi:hypothetical protein
MSMVEFGGRHEKDFCGLFVGFGGLWLRYG